jgi:SAM-dependent methyltransferase
MDGVEMVRQYYDDITQWEWERVERHPIEFEVTKRYIKRYTRPGDRVLDLGGGPGRYALFLAAYGCDVTLADLSSNNVEFAARKAEEQGLSLRTLQADARTLTALQGEKFDHILLMGPLYHLTEEADRTLVVENCLELLKPGGVLYAAFLSSYAIIIHYLKNAPDGILKPECQDDFQHFLNDRAFAGKSFTHSYFALRREILPFMAQFPLEKLHFLGAESLLSPNEYGILAQPPEVVAAWIDLAEKVCEREDLLSYPEHFLYVGRKKEDGI